MVSPFQSVSKTSFSATFGASAGAGSAFSVSSARSVVPKLVIKVIKMINRVMSFLFMALSGGGVGLEVCVICRWQKGACCHGCRVGSQKSQELP